MLVEQDVLCYHCGQPCEDESVRDGEKVFCCHGCKLVFEIIQTNNLCEYYNIEKHPGIKTDRTVDEEFLYLDDPEIQEKLVIFDSEKFIRIRFLIPAIHCTSCIWLLENLQKADSGILRNEVNFSSKSLLIDFNPKKIKLSRLASLLASLGYPPRINLESKPLKTGADHSLVTRLALAGFCAGNVMLLSFPEYLGLDVQERWFRLVFSWLSVALSVPVLVFSAKDYFTSAWRSFAQKQINIDVPIAAGLIALFGRSVWDIVSGYGPGYLDSFTGLVFFLLIGRWFQGKTYEALAFDRDFKSYFPLAVQVFDGAAWKPVVINNLRKGDRIRLRNLEIVPADSVLLDAGTYLDYSFVTGESRPVSVEPNGKVFAGGRLLGQPVELRVEKDISQSHLTSIWNHAAFRKREETTYKKTIDRAARIFTWVVLAIALITALVWYFINPGQMWLVLTAVLMVACPCALALAVPFTFGSMLRVFGRNHLYLKNADVIERMAAIDTIVLDKTGTITYGKEPGISFSGSLTKTEIATVKKLTGFSTHTLSAIITRSLADSGPIDVDAFREIPGKGIEGSSQGHLFRIGSPEFTGISETNRDSSRVYVSVDGIARGYFEIKVELRRNMQAMIGRLGPKCYAMISGDRDSDRAMMKGLFGPDTELHFNMSPHDKMEFIRSLQAKGRKVLMAGDGLNDAGALKQSDVGIAVTDDTGVFTPACDGILRGDLMESLDWFLDRARNSTTILKAAFVISFLYNTIALAFAVTGHLTPLVAAVLMPVSSISVVSFSTLLVNFVTRRTPTA